jgi:hypothetical protein
MKGLQFNICHLETSHLRNSDIHDLMDRTTKTISPHLAYSCQFFAAHLEATAFDDVIFGELKEFMYKRLLYWLEVLSLMKHVNLASWALSAVCQWVKVSCMIHSKCRY